MRRRSEPIQRLIAAVAVLASVIATDAIAQPRQAAPLAGAWILETAPHKVSGCVIRGAATATPARGGAFDVRIQVKESCPGGGAFTADEQCRAVVSAPRVTMSCTVVRAVPDNYNADSFQLEWRGRDLMVGRLVDTGFWDEPVTWRRAAPAMVS